MKNPAKSPLHPDMIWNGRALDFFEDRRLRQDHDNNNKMSSNMRSVPDL